MKMEDNTSRFEPLIERAEEYGKTTLNLFKYKALAKASDSMSGLASRGFVLLSVFMFILLASLGLALFIGDTLANTTYGFFSVAGIYAVLSFLIYLMRHPIKRSMNDSIVKQFFN